MGVMNPDIHHTNNSLLLPADLPPCYERVIVVGPDYRVPGYVDQLGIWHRDCDGAEFQSVVDWFSFK
jgi:hypothetical protein